MASHLKLREGRAEEAGREERRLLRGAATPRDPAALKDAAAGRAGLGEAASVRVEARAEGV